MNPDSAKSKGCCGGIANIETGKDIHLKGNTLISLKDKELLFFEPGGSSLDDGALYLALNSTFPPSTLISIPNANYGSENFSGINDNRPFGGDINNNRTLAVGDFTNLGFGEHTVITGVTGDDLTTTTSATLYTVYASTGRAYLEQEAITRKTGDADIFQGSITYSAGDANLISGALLKPGSTGDALASFGAYAEVAGYTGNINTLVNARGFTGGGDILLRLQSVLDNGASITEIIMSPDSIVINGLNEYANDGLADSDSDLPSNGLYKITGDRAIYQKP